MTIKAWFLNKNFTSNERTIIENADMGGELIVVRETEKAVNFKAVSDYGTLVFWCPKSCLTVNETEEERKINEEKSEKISSGLAYNELLVSYAKSKGIKGIRKGMKTVTLIQKIKSAGYEVPSRSSEKTNDCKEFTIAEIREIVDNHDKKASIETLVNVDSMNWSKGDSTTMEYHFTLNGEPGVCPVWLGGK